MIRKHFFDLHILGILFLISLFFYCGNPKVHYSIMKYQASIIPKKEKENNKSWIRIHVSKDHSFWFEFLSKKTFDYLLDLADIDIERNSRIPSLQYFRFKFKYTGEKPLEVDFFKAYFVDEFGKKYKAIRRKEFIKKYTSVAYAWVDYHKLFIPYKKVSKELENGQGYVPFHKSETFQEKEKRQEKQDTGAKGKLRPFVSHRTKIKVNSRKESIFHLVPFPNFSIGSRKFKLLLDFKLDGQTKQIKMPFLYVSNRDDMKKSH